MQTRREAWWRSWGQAGGLWSLLLRSGLCPPAHRECLGVTRAQFAATAFLPQERHKAGFSTEPCDSWVTAARRLGGACVTEWGRKSLPGSISVGAGGGTGGRWLATFCWRSLSPEHRTQRIHSSMCHVTGILPCRLVNRKPKRAIPLKIDTHTPPQERVIIP